MGVVEGWGVGPGLGTGEGGGVGAWEGAKQTLAEVLPAAEQVPAGQAAHTALPPSAKEQRGQGPLGAPRPVPLQKDPASQAAQAVLPVAAW